MKRLQNFYNYLDTILMVIILYVEGLVVKTFEETFFKNNLLVFLCTIFFFVAIFKLAEWLIGKVLIGKSEFFRKVILGEDFVEGTWFDMIVNSDTGAKTFGLSTNTMKDENIYQNGEQFSADGSPLNIWGTIASQLIENTLTIVYRVNYFDEKIVEQRLGIRTISYSKTAKQKRPNTFIGVLYDMSGKFYTKSYYGFKVTEKEILKELANPQTKREALRKLMGSDFFKAIHSDEII